MIVEDTELKGKWRFTGFYGTLYIQDKEDSWAVLKNLCQDENAPWFVCGDFNEIMYGLKKREVCLEMKEEWNCFKKH